MIDFTFTQEQEDFRKQVADFTASKIAPKAKEMEQNKTADKEVV